MHHNSIENRKLRSSHEKKFHPVKPYRGEIYNAFITEGVGSELCGNHLVVIIQNKKANIYSEKVNVLPIEGDGTKINPKKIALDDNRVNIVYEITEGHPTYIRDIKFEGNKKFRSKDLRGAILSREHAWWRLMTQFDVFDEDRIQYDQQMLRQFYMRNGHVDFQVKNANGVFTPDRQYYSVTFTVDEGPVYKFGTLSIDNPFPDVPDEKLMEIIKMKTGDVYNIDKVEETISAMRGMVGDHGYAFISVEPDAKKNDDARTIDLKFKIKKRKMVGPRLR